MKLQMHSIHFNADQKLIAFIDKRIKKLRTFYDKMLDGEVFLKINNNGVENKTVEIKLNIPGGQFFAKEDARSFEKATDKAAEALRRQIRKHKDKQKLAA